jgi:PadR family transcriptional regulator PadR
MGKDITNQAYWQGVINMSLCKFFVLRALSERPMYGYELIQAVERQTDGFCVPSEGAVYPILKEFEGCSCVTSHEEVVGGRKRKIYTLTPKGRDGFELGAKLWREGLRHIEAATEIVPT